MPNQADRLATVAISKCGDQRVIVEDTYKENDLVIHKTAEILTDPGQIIRAVVDSAGKKGDGQ